MSRDRCERCPELRHRQPDPTGAGLSGDGMSYTLTPTAKSNCNDNYTSAHK
jgi:hypothetical protein